MLEEIKKLIYTKYGANDKVWLFFSLFDEKGTLLVSNGVLETDKPLDTLIDLLYNGMIKKRELQAKNLVFDIVQSVQVQTDVANFLNLSPKEYGVVLVTLQDGKSGVLLPNTKGVDTMQQALASIKQKYQLSGNVTMSTFQTERIVLSK